MNEQEMEQVITAIDMVMGRRMEEVYGELEKLRGEFQTTINVMDQSIMAIISRMQETTPENVGVAEFMESAGAAWERFIRREAEILGLIGGPRTKGRKVEMSLGREGGGTEEVEIRG